MKLSGPFLKNIPDSKLNTGPYIKILKDFMPVSGYNAPFHITYIMINIKVYFFLLHEGQNNKYKIVPGEKLDEA